MALSIMMSSVTVRVHSSSGMCTQPTRSWTKPPHTTQDRTKLQADMAAACIQSQASSQTKHTTNSAAAGHLRICWVPMPETGPSSYPTTDPGMQPGRDLVMQPGGPGSLLGTLPGLTRVWHSSTGRHTATLLQIDGPKQGMP
jgi:hypothetical protein